ncbi:MAG: TolC family protein [Prevotella sp.]
MRTFKINKIICLLAISFCSVNAGAQRVITINDAIKIGQKNSLDAMIARLNFMSQYWSFRSFKAQLLPSVNLSGDLFEFNRSMVEARNYETGEVSLVKNNTMSNNMSLSVNQEIVPLGGRVSVESYLYRLDQYSYDKKIYNSQPFRISYTQPLRAFNSLRWSQKTEPLKYEKAKRIYLENMEDVTVNAVNLYFSVLSAQSSYQQSVNTLQDRQQLYKMSEQRFEIGSITKNDLLQLKLSLLNAEVEKNNMEIELKNQRFRLFSYLRISDYNDIRLIAPDNIPAITVNAEEVVSKALKNSQHVLSQQLNILDAERNLKEAKANKGLQMSIHGAVGFSRTTNHFADAYRNLENSEIVGLTFSLPIFDWGVSKGRVRMAKSDLEAVRTQMGQAREKYIEDLQTMSMKFNMQATQCNQSRLAQDIAEERYGITKNRFETGSISVTDLNTAQQELESARNQYINQLQSFWVNYYTLRRYTLYDWINHTDLTADYDELIDGEK